ncbi:MAG: type transport system ATP-binding protein [Acidobacteriaceae bacterium]|nr:type transport system ATP-binding protein [Acidobacteriaceae bacterium]
MSALAFTPEVQPFPARPLATTQTHQPIATLTNITKRYGTTIALDDLSLSLHPGEVVALLGPNGAGKSTAVKLLLGPIEGAVRNYLSEAIAKLGASNRVDAARIARAKGRL